MASVNYAARAQNALIDRFEGLVRTLRQTYQLLQRGRSDRARALLEQELDGVLSDATDSDEAAEQSDEAAEQPADMPAGSWALQWYEQLPHGPCRRAVAAMLVPNDEQALLQAFAYAQQHYPEEIVLWTLAGGVVPDPWNNDSVQAGVRSSLLALRNLREARPAADVPGQDVVPFSGVGHQLS